MTGAFASQHLPNPLRDVYVVRLGHILSGDAQSIVRLVRGDMTGDDHRVKMVVRALEYMAEWDGNDCHLDDNGMQFALDMADETTTAQLIEWLGSHARRIEYVDAFRCDGDNQAQSVMEEICGGYCREAEDVYDKVLQWLKDHDVG